MGVKKENKKENFCLHCNSLWKSSQSWTDFVYYVIIWIVIQEISELEAINIALNYTCVYITYIYTRILIHRDTKRNRRKIFSLPRDAYYTPDEENWNKKEKKKNRISTNVPIFRFCWNLIIGWEVFFIFFLQLRNLLRKRERKGNKKKVDRNLSDPKIWNRKFIDNMFRVCLRVTRFFMNGNQRSGFQKWWFYAPSDYWVSKNDDMISKNDNLMSKMLLGC